MIVRWTGMLACELGKRAAGTGRLSRLETMRPNLGGGKAARCHVRLGAGLRGHQVSALCECVDCSQPYQPCARMLDANSRTSESYSRFIRVIPVFRL